MAYPQTNDMMRAMSMDMKSKLGGYYTSLQTRYGDPRVYQAQEEQMRRDQASIAHAKSRNTSQLLEDVYVRQQQRNRAVHNTRISTQTGRKSSSRPESRQPRATRSRKTPPVSEPVPASDQGQASATR